MPSFAALPAEIVERILAFTMISSRIENKLETYHTLRLVCQLWKIIVDSDRIKILLPKIYFSNLKVLPEAKNGKLTVTMRRIINSMGKRSGLVLSLKHIINDSKWNLAWLQLSPLPYGWFLILKIFIRKIRCKKIV